MRGKKLDKDFFLSLVKKYYSLREWNEKGEPTESVLSKYGI
jgi:aldehyde:ferredoxin oxidoreductase